LACSANIAINGFSFNYFTSTPFILVKTTQDLLFLIILPFILLLEWIGIEIVQAGIKDIALLHDIAGSTFKETNWSTSSNAHIQAYLEIHFSLSNLEKEMTTEGSRFYFAKSSESVIGYLKLNFLQQANGLEIERIYVLKAFHGKQVGYALFNFSKDLALDKGCTSLCLAVWEKNDKAIRFYEKQGLVAYDKKIFQLGGEIQTDVLMRLNL
jgi:diamine N-acetyltransferase